MAHELEGRHALITGTDPCIQAVLSGQALDGSGAIHGQAMTIDRGELAL